MLEHIADKGKVNHFRGEGRRRIVNEQWLTLIVPSHNRERWFVSEFESPAAQKATCFPGWRKAILASSGLGASEFACRIQDDL